MVNTTSKLGNFEPMLYKIGIPLALSAASSVCAIIMSRGGFPASIYKSKTNLLKPKSKLKENENLHSQNSANSLSLEEEESSSSESEDRIEEVISGLRRRVEDLEKKEVEIERQFIWYQNLKERESLLVELRNTLVLDMAHISFLEREILLMEEENKKFESLVSEYLGVSEQLEGQKSENKLLDREVKKLRKKLKEQSKIIREKNLKIEEIKAEVWRNGEEMETKKKVIEKLGNEVRELKMQLEELQEEENRASAKFKVEADERSVTVEDFNKLSNEFKQLKDAFSKQGLSRNHDQEEQNHKEIHEEVEGNEGVKQEIKGKNLDKNEFSSVKTNSTRPKLLPRISCVGGSNEKMERKIRPE